MVSKKSKASSRARVASPDVYMLSARTPGYPEYDQRHAFSTLANAKRYALDFAHVAIRNRDDDVGDKSIALVKKPKEIKIEWHDTGDRVWASVYLTKPKHPDPAALEFVIISYVRDKFLA
mgnify:CR=1 FL=1